MLDAIYIGLTGLTGYSKDLTIIGNNAANLNTPGFKSQQLLFTDLFYQAKLAADNGGSTRLDIGAGLNTPATRRNFKPGELRQTGGDQDVAIEGNGFFVLRRDGQTFLTRDGQFSFDEQGFFVSSVQNARVAALVGGDLHDININDLRTVAGRATSRIEFAGTLNTNDAATAPHTVGSIPVFDSAGGSHTFAVKFTNNGNVTPSSWLVEVTDERNTVLQSGEIRFGSDGTPAAGFNSIVVASPSGASGSQINLFFGDPGSTTGARSLSAAASDLRLATQDGLAAGSLTRATFDIDGALALTYSNGLNTKGDRLAIATVRGEQSLEPREGNLFVAPDDDGMALGTANTGPFGKVQAGRVEISNVDLAQEFSDLIISQRGYQASSQVISAANEMIQQLFEIKQRG
jgi:flagellar hook protein FlgE